MRALWLVALLIFALPVLAQKAPVEFNIGDTDIQTKRDQPLSPITPIETVNNWVLMALNTEKKQLKGGGPFECRHVFPDARMGDYKFKARDQTPDLAHARVGALCIKSRCENLSKIFSRALTATKNVSDEDVAEYFLAQGVPSAEVKRRIEARRASDYDLAKVKCETATQDVRDLIYMTCFITPIECKKR